MTFRARYAVGTLFLVTGRPELISFAGSGPRMITSSPRRMPWEIPRCRVGEFCSCRMNLGPSLNTRFSAALPNRCCNVFHGDAMKPSIGEALPSGRARRTGIRPVAVMSEGCASIPWEATHRRPSPGDSHQQLRRPDVHRAGADSELLHHRPHRPRQVDAGGPD